MRISERSMNDLNFLIKSNLSFAQFHLLLQSIRQSIKDPNFIMHVYMLTYEQFVLGVAYLISYIHMFFSSQKNMKGHAYL